MKEPRYIDALKAGWDLAWHHKSLWLFGLFAAFLGQMGIVEILSKSVMGAAKLSEPSVMVSIWRVFVDLPVKELFAGLTGGQWVGMIWLGIILLGLFVAGVFVAVTAQGAIVHSADRYIAKRGKFEDSSKAWHASQKHFWKLLTLNVLRKVLIVVFVIFVSWGTINALDYPTTFDLILYLVLFLLAVGMGMILSILLIYAVGYVVVEDARLWQSIRAAWRLFTDHWLVSFEIGFIFIFLNVFVLGLLFVGMYFLFLPTMFLWAMSITIGSNMLFLVGMGMGITLFGLYALFIGSVFSVFTTATWTYLFTKMHRRGIISHVVHLFKK